MRSGGGGTLLGLQVWSAEITYIRLERGFAYLAAVIDW